MQLFMGPGVGSTGLGLYQWIQDYFADLTDVTLADEDSNFYQLNFFWLKSIWNSWKKLFKIWTQYHGSVVPLAMF